MVTDLFNRRSVAVSCKHVPVVLAHRTDVERDCLATAFSGPLAVLKDAGRDGGDRLDRIGIAVLLACAADKRFATRVQLRQRDVRRDPAVRERACEFDLFVSPCAAT